MAAINTGVRLPYPWIDGLTRRQQYQIWSNFQALSRMGTSTRWATLVIAASDSTEQSKSKADYVCNGSNDAAVIQAAIDSLSTRSQPGRLVFLEGTYTLATTIIIDNDERQDFVIQGMGAGNSPSPFSLSPTTGLHVNCKIVGPGGGQPAIQLNGIGISGNIMPHYGFLDIGIDGNGGPGIRVNHNHYVDITINNCSIKGTDAIATSTNTLASNIGVLKISDSDLRATSGYGIFAASVKTLLIDGNQVSGPNGILIRQYGGSSTPGVISNNYINVTGSYGIRVDPESSSFARSLLITGNNIGGTSSTTGILIDRANDFLIAGNLIRSCNIGVILEGGSGTAVTGDNLQVVGNGFVNCTTAVRLQGSTGLTRPSVTANVARGATTALSIGSGVRNAVNLANDWGGAAVSDAGTNTSHYSPGANTSWVGLQRVRVNSGGSTYSRHGVNFIGTGGITISAADDATDDEVDVTFDATGASKVTVRKNSGADVGSRPRLNLIEGSGITLTTADDPTDNEVDVTIAATPSPVTVRKNSVTVGSRAQLNFIEGTGVTLTTVDDGTEVDITINASGGGGSGTRLFEWANCR